MVIINGMASGKKPGSICLSFYAVFDKHIERHTKADGQ